MISTHKLQNFRHLHLREETARFVCSKTSRVTDRKGIWAYNVNIDFMQNSPFVVIFRGSHPLSSSIPLTSENVT
jgi:hypothetical protein